MYLGQFPAKTGESLLLVPVSTTLCLLASSWLPRLLAAQVSHWFGVLLLGREKGNGDKMEEWARAERTQIALGGPTHNLAHRASRALGMFLIFIYLIWHNL